MKLIFIHGRKQENRDPIELRETWVKTWEDGLNKSNLAMNIDEQDIIFPYYGDLLANLTAIFSDKANKIYEEDIDLYGPEFDFYNDFLTELAKNAGISEQSIQDELMQGMNKKDAFPLGMFKGLIRV